jgi:hypothetical protein
MAAEGVGWLLTPLPVVFSDNLLLLFFHNHLPLDIMFLCMKHISLYRYPRPTRSGFRHHQTSKPHRFFNVESGGNVMKCALMVVYKLKQP